MKKTEFYDRLILGSLTLTFKTIVRGNVHGIGKEGFNN